MLDAQAKGPGIDLLRDATHADLISRASAGKPHPTEDLGGDRQIERHDAVDDGNGDSVHSWILQQAPASRHAVEHRASSDEDAVGRMPMQARLDP